MCSALQETKDNTVKAAKTAAALLHANLYS